MDIGRIGGYVGYNRSINQGRRRGITRPDFLADIVHLITFVDVVPLVCDHGNGIFYWAASPKRGEAPIPPPASSQAHINRQRGAQFAMHQQSGAVTCAGRLLANILHLEANLFSLRPQVGDDQVSNR
jgi:hypothetical protein